MPITGAFYEAAVIPELWKDTLNLASHTWGADGITISSHPDCLGGLISSQGVEDLCARYVTEEWFKDDVRAARGVAAIKNGRDIVTDTNLFTVKELEQLPYYSEFLTRSGFRWFAGAVLGETGGLTITLSADRRTTRDFFSDNDLARIRLDLPHVRRAAQLAMRFRLAYAEGVVDGIEQFDCGAILLDRIGRVIRMNKKAEAYLGQDLQLVSSRLRSSYRETDKSLQELIASSIQSVIRSKNLAPAVALLSRPNDLPLVANSYPIVRQAADVFQGASAILLIRDLSKHRPVALKILQEAFKLTPAELRVTAALLRGLDTNQMAGELRVEPETVRYHLKSLFAKTGTRHQAQLVSLFARFPKSSNTQPVA